jgi:hypothetical protein
MPRLEAIFRELKIGEMDHGSRTQVFHVEHPDELQGDGVFT